MPEHLGKMIMDTAHIIKHNMNAFMGRPELNGLQVRILEYVTCAEQRGEDVFRGDIGRTFKIKMPSVTSVLNTMEKNGYILRLPVEKDRRLKKIALTDKARQIEKVMYSKIEQFEDILALGITARELDTFGKVLDKITENTEYIKR